MKTPGNPRSKEIVTDLLKLLDPDPNRKGLEETPQRVIDAWGEWTSGYHCAPSTFLKTFEDGADGVDEMVLVGNIPFYSTCEHHLATFFGIAHVGYIPTGKIVGLSKIVRVVEAFARRLSVQERITNQIADTINGTLSPKGVGVVLQARHMCMESRGINRPGTITTTAALRGVVKDAPDARAEFYSMIQLQRGTTLG